MLTVSDFKILSIWSTTPTMASCSGLHSRAVSSQSEQDMKQHGRGLLVEISWDGTLGDEVLVSVVDEDHRNRAGSLCTLRLFYERHLAAPNQHYLAAAQDKEEND